MHVWKVYRTVRKTASIAAVLPWSDRAFHSSNLLFSAMSTSNLQAAPRDPPRSRLSLWPELPTVPIAARLATLNGHAAHHVLQQSLLKLRLLESQSLVRKKSLPNWLGSLRLSRQIHRCFNFAVD